jgi:hypothetical protein
MDRRNPRPEGSKGVRGGMARAALLCCAALLWAACAGTKEVSQDDAGTRAPMDKVLARMVFKGEYDRAVRIADSLAASKEPAEREIASYWKAVTWLYRGEPDSALAILEGNQGKWTGGLRKVHAGLFLNLARESSAAKLASNRVVRHEDPAKPAPDKSLQDRVDALQKENGDLRAEAARLVTEKEKYQKLLNDLETIR